MGRTIFGKTMIVFMVIIMVSLLLSGLMMSQVVRDAYLSDSETQMFNLADDVETLYGFFDQGYLSMNQAVIQVQQKAEGSKNVIWVVTADDGTVWLAVDPSNQTTISKQQIQDYYGGMKPILQRGKSVKMISQSGNFFNTPVITVAQPALDEDGNICAYIFVHRELSEMEASLMAMYRQILLTAGISALLGIILTYLFTRSMLRPLSVVTTGAKQLARGKFDIYLEVKSKDELGQLADTFNSVAKDLKKHEQTRENLIANVSHELRSPLTSIQGLLQAVLDGTIAPEDRDYYLDVVLGESKRLNLLISDLLDLAKLESGQFPMQIERVDINELIRRALVTFESKIEAKNLSVHLDLSEGQEFVMCDIARISQVMQNLLENAIKFANEGGLLRVYTSTTQSSVLVNVNNSGETIAKEDIPYVFDRFFKTDKSHSRQKEGTGIGLSLVKNILKGHGQKIWVQSDSIQGTTFTFTLKKG